jgi:hypothetical protein
MPIYKRFDSNKNQYYFQYGDTGKKYYFTTLNNSKIAYKKALKQAQAIHAKGKYN